MSDKQQERIVFRASGVDFIVFWIKSTVLVSVTFGLYSFFVPRALRCWKISHSSLQGHPLKFVGGLWSFVKGTLIDAVLMIVTLGLYLPWSVVAQKAAGINNTAVDDGRRFRFQGSAGQVIGLSIISAFAIVFSLGLALPWVFVRWKRWEWENTKLSRGPQSGTDKTDDWQKLRFTGRSWSLFKTFIVDYFLTVITLGIYSFWAAVNITRWEFENVVLED
jgi:uncharacterized membrane protein YjgN (DUF898 family)